MRDNEYFIGLGVPSPDQNDGCASVERPASQIASEYLSLLPLPAKADGVPIKALSNAIRNVQKTGGRLVIVSTVCPSYSADEQGVPDYKDLETGISPNTQRHFDNIPRANGILEQNGIGYVHFFLMADTEVDLLPFLTQLEITPEEFTTRCQESVDNIGTRVAQTYKPDGYREEGIPYAARFLDYFGPEVWFPRYEKYLNRLLAEREADSESKVARALEYDCRERKVLITKLLGSNITKEDAIRHIARQKAQYMAFASLMREKFGQRLVVVNHRTPNLAWMNDKITREPDNPEGIQKGSYLHQLPLIELDINTLPNN